MFKVICINGVKVGDTSNKGYSAENQDCIYEGEIYTVVSKTNSGFGYVLAERERFTYKVHRFVPLSNIDETELLAERYGVYAENNF